MSYRFETPDRLALEIRRVATERLRVALTLLGEELDNDPVGAVHGARKDLKKTRSLLRLVRDNLGEHRYRTENDRLREAAHFLAGAREADARVEALEALVGEGEGQLSAEATLAARGWIATLRGAKAGRKDVTQAAASAAVLITRAHDDARLWGLGYGSFDLIEAGLRRNYRRGRRLLAAATISPDDETMHEWRKRVKDMWYSLRLLQCAWPAVLGEQAEQAHRLSELLGDHHDLGEVREEIESGAPGLSPAAHEELLGAVAAKQADLHESAISLGRRLYAERPGRYVARLEEIWSAWEEDAAQQIVQVGLPGS